ncbi:hypothetical protein WG66_011937 [Moniliophthora roreri]|nr:hypothetical protein WG66_011937 [Moniliophthora roreri]
MDDNLSRIHKPLHERQPVQRSISSRSTDDGELRERTSGSAMGLAATIVEEENGRLDCDVIQKWERLFEFLRSFDSR